MKLNHVENVKGLEKNKSKKLNKIHEFKDNDTDAKNDNNDDFVNYKDINKNACHKNYETEERESVSNGDCSSDQGSDLDSDTEFDELLCRMF